jgi:hypothetical protein
MKNVRFPILKVGMGNQDFLFVGDISLHRLNSLTKKKSLIFPIALKNTGKTEPCQFFVVKRNLQGNTKAHLSFFPYIGAQKLIYG